MVSLADRAAELPRLLLFFLLLGHIHSRQKLVIDESFGKLAAKIGQRERLIFLGLAPLVVEKGEGVGLGYGSESENGFVVMNA